MLYFIPLLSALMGYKKCPQCGKMQKFNDKKRGDIVVCKKCGQELVLNKFSS